MDVSKTIDHIQFKIKIPNPCQEPPASSKAPNEDTKNIDILCTFKIKIERQNLEHGNYIQIQIKIQNPNQEPTLFFQSPTFGHQGRKLNFGTWVYQIPVTMEEF